MLCNREIQCFKASSVNIEILILCITDIKQFSARCESGSEFFHDCRLNLVMGTRRKIILISFDNQRNTMDITILGIFIAQDFILNGELTDSTVPLLGTV